MVSNKSQILNVSIDNVTMQYLLEHLKEGAVVTPNIDHLIQLQRNKAFYDAYKGSEWVVCDSRVLYFLSKFTKTPLCEAIPGVTFFREFFLYHKNDEDCKIFLLGAKEGVAKIAMKNINKMVNREIVVGEYSPKFGYEKDPDEIEKMIDIVNKSGANAVLVGVGAPKQELFIYQYRNRMPHVKIWMALGATIDYEAGMLKRAPKLAQKLGLEWLCRMAQDPGRLVPRVCRDLSFFPLFFKQIIGKYQDPFASCDN